MFYLIDIDNCLRFLSWKVWILTHDNRSCHFLEEISVCILDTYENIENKRKSCSTLRKGDKYVVIINLGISII